MINVKFIQLRGFDGSTHDSRILPITHERTSLWIAAVPRNDRLIAFLLSLDLTDEPLVAIWYTVETDEVTQVNLAKIEWITDIQDRGVGDIVVYAWAPSAYRLARSHLNFVDILATLYQSMLSQKYLALAVPPGSRNIEATQPCSPPKHFIQKTPQ